MKLITGITRRDILAQVMFKDFMVEGCKRDGTELKVRVSPPSNGWSHDMIEKVAHATLEDLFYGEAYVGNQWVGSAEI